MMDPLQRTPIDPHAARKGDVITTDAIERYTGVARDAPEFWKAKLRTLEAVRRLLEQTGKPWVVRTEQDCLKILTDDEAAPYTNQTGRNALRQFGRAVRLQHHVDANQLDDESRRRHYNALAVNATVLQGIRSSRAKAVKALPHRRDRPGLPGGEGGQT
jgi:hypothetical protein